MRNINAEIIQRNFPDIKDGLIRYRSHKGSGPWSVCSLREGRVEPLGENQGHSYAVHNDIEIEQLEIVKLAKRTENKAPLSERVRPSSEVAPWVYDEIVLMEKESDHLREAFKVLEELQECSHYWSEYYVPIGIHERIDTAIKNVKDVDQSGTKEGDKAITEFGELRKAARQLCIAASRVIVTAPDSGPLWYGSPEMRGLRQALYPDNLKQLMRSAEDTPQEATDV